MSRQVISYGDLTPLDASSQATPSEFAGVNVKESNLPAIAGFGSPTSKKRRRDEGSATFETNAQRIASGNGNNSSSSSKNGGSLSSFQALPPKPPVKKRRNKRRSAAGSNMSAAMDSAPHANIQHWDDPGAQEDGISYDEGAGEVNGTANVLNEGNWETDENGETAPNAEVADEDEDDVEEDESRELTHEEIWDDSALIAAWDAANEEYEAIHGKTKRWKRDRVHKSPLWYNIPPEKPITVTKEAEGKTKSNANGASSAEGRSYEAPGAQGSEVETSMPLNFETFVPTHDPSLAFPNPQHPPPVPGTTQSHLKDIASHYSAMLSGSPFQGSGGAPATESAAHSGAVSVSVDEAFSRATSAMYWCGYWTAVYHVRRAHEQGSAIAANFEAEDSSEALEEEAAELVSTQR